MEQAQRHRQAALDAAKAILTPEQWNSVPERIKNPRNPGGAEQRRAPPQSE